MENRQTWPFRPARSGPVVLAVVLIGLFLAIILTVRYHPLSAAMAIPPLSSTSALQTELADLQKDNMYQQAQIRSLRAMLGSLSCRVQNVGPTGGFCLSAEKPGESPGLNMVDEAYANLLGELFTGQTVLDVGTGLGNYGKWFEKNAPSVAWEGTDGAENIEEVTEGWVKFADFTEELRWTKRNWVMSIEVGEHVAKQHEGVFVDNLCGLAKVGVVISWARPGQGGYAHVNEKSFDDVKQMFLDRGLTSDESLGLKLRTAASVSWLATNTQVFRWPKHLTDA